MLGGILDALVEHHRDVRTQRLLNLDGLFRRKGMLGPIEVRTENHTVIGDFAEIGQAKHLKAAGIGEDRPRPGHETMQPAQAPDPFVARPKIKMISVAKQDLNAKLAERLLRQSLHRALRPDRHERRRVDHAMRCCETPQPRARRIGLQNFEMEFHPFESSRTMGQCYISISVLKWASGPRSQITFVMGVPPAEGA